MAAPLSSLLLLLCSYCLSRRLPCLSLLTFMTIFFLSCCIFTQPYSGWCENQPLLLLFLIDWLSGWVWGCFACLASLIFFLFFVFFVRRYNTEGFYVLDFPSQHPVTQSWCWLFSSKCKNAYCSLTNTHIHTHIVLKAFCGKHYVSLGSSLEGKISPVCGFGLWSSSPVPHTWRKHFLRSGALKEYLCECQAYD